MPRTATPAPTDRSMWRRLLLRVHPDQGGDGELFVWARDLQGLVMGERDGCAGPGAATGGPGPTRVDFPGEAGADHARLTDRAVAMAADVGSPHARLLRMLAGCSPSPGGRQERRGATYKQLALVAHLAGMDAAGRVGWYEIARGVPLSQRHAGHLIERLEAG